MQLSDSCLKLAEHARQDWRVTLPEGTPYEAVFKREFWAHVAFKFQPGDEISVSDERKSFYAKLFVRACDRLWAAVGEVEMRRFDAETEGESSALEVVWKGPKLRYCVVRQSDNERVKDGFQLKEDAEGWVADHLKAVNA